MMDREQLLGQYARLRRELDEAYSATAWRAGRIDRLAEDLAVTERALAGYQPRDEQTNESFPAFAR